MDEYVFPGVPLDKAITLIVVEPFDGTDFHTELPPA